MRGSATQRGFIMNQCIGVIGLCAVIAACYGLSQNRKRVDWKLVGYGVALQVILAVVVLKSAPGRAAFDYLNQGFDALMRQSKEGASFLFGGLTEQVIPVTDEKDAKVGGLIRLGASFAFAVLPSVVFFSCLMAILYHVGVMHRIVYWMALAMKKTLKTSGAESLSAAANIFVGQTEAPLLIRPYLEKMTRSEILAVMVGGMANIAGGVLAAYVAMLSDKFPDIAGHLIAGSIMSAPASLVLAKILLPEEEVPETAGDVDANYVRIDANVIDAATRGASEGLTLALNIAAQLLCAVALVALCNSIWGALCGWATSVTGYSLAHIDSFQEILGYAFAPIAWLLGIPSQDCLVAGKLLGEKTILNEFVAYAHMGDYLHGKPLMDGAPVQELTERTKIILSYALCGFANVGSIGVLVGGMGALMPTRRGDIARLGILALVGGTCSTFMTAIIAGLIL
jgi:CNT family concentrative nucleoside transporter